MKISSRIVLILLLLLLFAGTATFISCGNKRYEPQSTPKQAEQYYNDKYSLSEHVTASQNIGHSDGVMYKYYGTQYTMSDDSIVLYNDNSRQFKDNRQTEELKQVSEEYLNNMLRDVPGTVLPLQVQSVDGRYEKGIEYWETFYNGDIEDCLLQEHPNILFRTAELVGNIAPEMNHVQDKSEGKHISFNAIYKDENYNDVVKVFERLAKLGWFGDVRCLFVVGDNDIAWGHEPFSDVAQNQDSESNLDSFSSENIKRIVKFSTYEGELEIEDIDLNSVEEL